MKLKISSKQLTWLLVGVLSLASLFFAYDTWANVVGETIGIAVAAVCMGLIWVLGKILAVVMYILIGVAQYNDFIHAEPVSYGWKIVRDVCNMFFVLILLIIAFATVLQVEKFNYKKLLPKLIMMAVLINFSKLICGFFIDFAQVIMLTFVNGFKEIGGGNLTEMMGVSKLLAIDTSGDSEDVSGWTIAGAALLALIYVIISLVVLITLVMVLVMRIIMIWIYVVLSPMAYLLSSVPQGEGYAGQWWSEFSKNLIVGPVLAFFIWLSFVSLGGVAQSDTITKMNATMQPSGTTFDANGVAISATSTVPVAAITEAGSPEHMLKFFISIAMLIGGLQISQQIGGAAGGMAAKGLNKIKNNASKMGSWAGKKGADYGKRAAIGSLATVKTVGGYVDKFAGRVMAKDAKSNLAQVGLVGAGIGGIRQGINNFGSKYTPMLKKRTIEKEEQQKIRRDMADNKDNADHSVTYRGKKYTKDNDGNYTNAEVGALTFKNSRGKDKVATAMSSSAAAFYDSRRKSFSSIRSEGKNKSAKDVAEEMEKINKSDINIDELKRSLDNPVISVAQKQAVAMTLAKRGVLDRNTMAKTDGVFDRNEFAKKEFVNNVHQNKQSHLLYKLDDIGADGKPTGIITKEVAEGRAMAKKDMSIGKFNGFDLREDAAEEAGMHIINEEHYGKYAYGQRVGDMAKTADGKAKLQEGIKRAKNERMISTGGELVDADGNIDTFVKALANLGNPLDAFAESVEKAADGVRRGTFNDKGIKAMDEFHKQAGPNYLENLDQKDVQSNEAVFDSLMENIDATTVASAKRSGKANKTVQFVVDAVKSGAASDGQRDSFYYNNVTNAMMSEKEADKKVYSGDAYETPEQRKKKADDLAKAAANKPLKNTSNYGGTKIGPTFGNT